MAVDSFNLLLTVIGLTLVFEFSNGWHDAANSIATVVSTRVLTPFSGGSMGGFLEFCGGFCFWHSGGENDWKRDGPH